MSTQNDSYCLAPLTNVFRPDEPYGQPSNDENRHPALRAALHACPAPQQRQASPPPLQDIHDNVDQVEERAFEGGWCYGNNGQPRIWCYLPASGNKNDIQYVPGQPIFHLDPPEYAVVFFVVHAGGKPNLQPPVVQNAAESIEEPMVEPMVEPMEDDIEEPIDESMEEPNEEEPIDELRAQPAAKPAKKKAKKGVKKAVKKPKAKGLCPACSKREIGRNCYGVKACKECFKFFHRVVQNKDKKKECKENDELCALNGMKGCIPCRFQRCLKLGMNPDQPKKIRKTKKAKNA